MGKVFQVESKNSGVFMGLVGGVLISLLLFMVCLLYTSDAADE